MSEVVAVSSAPAATQPTAVVILVGETGQNHELAALLAELLEREGVRAFFEREALFEPNALLGEVNTDARVRVYVTLSKERSARLYFRGPLGQRFILRPLQLPGSLDEVGRESIARVVATSTAALLDSSALIGIDRETAKTTLAREAKKEVAPAATPKPAPPPPPITPQVPQRVSMKYELGARGVTRWVGAPSGAAFGMGAEAGLTPWPSSRLFHRERLVGEYLAPRTITAPELDLSVSAVALRGGVDLGISRGAHAFLMGLGAGIDIFWISPDQQNDPNFSLSDKSTGVVPLVRTELRYEYSLSSLLVAAAAFADIALRGTHYDVRDNGVTRRIAEPWRIRPGLALILAWQPSLYRSNIGTGDTR